MDSEPISFEAVISKSATSADASVSPTDKPRASVDIIIHLGAGKCRELEQHLSLHPSRIVLVEADSGLVEQLVQKTAGNPSIEVIHQAVFDQDSECIFHRFNQPDVNSLQSPGAKLIELFPGLRTLSEENISTVDLDKLFSSLKIHNKTLNRLIVDIPGAEQNILNVLRRNKKAPLFTEISWNLCNEPLYEDSSSKSEFIAQLEELGYDLIGERPALDSQFVETEFRLNSLKIENLNLRHELSDLRSRYENLTSVNLQLKLSSESLSESFNESIATTEDLRQQLSEQDKTNEIQLEETKELKILLRSVEQSLQDRSKALDEAQATVEKLQLQLSERDETKQTQEQIIKGLKSQLHSVELTLQENSNALNEAHATVKTQQLHLSERDEVIQDQSLLIENLTNQKQLAEKASEESSKILENLKSDLKQSKDEQAQAHARIAEIQSINNDLNNQLLDIEQQRNNVCHTIEKISLYIHDNNIFTQTEVVSDNDMPHSIEHDGSHADLEQDAINSCNETKTGSSEHGCTSSHQSLYSCSHALTKLSNIDAAIHAQELENEELQRKLATYTHRESEQSSQLVEARSTINLLTQIATLRDNDLKDLQSQYSELREICIEQASAICTIKEKLNFANNELATAMSKKRVNIKSAKTKPNGSAKKTRRRAAQ